MIDPSVVNPCLTNLMKRIAAEKPAASDQAMRNRRLFHYTPMTNFISIVEDGYIWSGHIASLNDGSELLHAISILRRAIKQRKAQTKDPETLQFLLTLDSECASVKTLETAGLFIICFSEKWNDLSQWRAYGGPSGGVAIEFKFDSLIPRGPTDGLLLPVIYRRSVKLRILTDALVDLEMAFLAELKSRSTTAPLVSTDKTKLASEMFSSWFDLGGWALFLAFKHSGFEREREWRLAYRLSTQGTKDLRFVQHQSMISTHWPIRIGPTPSQNQPYTLPISGVVVGPTTHPHISHVVVGDLLVKKGYNLSNIVIRRSKTPFRPSR